MLDLEASVDRVWDRDLRPLVQESLRCYNAGAVRAAIAATWTAVVADLLGKVGQLAEEGEPIAQAMQKQVVKAQEQGLSPEGVRTMQAIEDQLLKTAVDLELIDSIGQRDLERIRQDRHLCVHPSLRRHGEAYQPEPEVARAHLAVALTTLLLHPPVQGQRIQTSFTNYVTDPTFSPAPSHLQSTYFDRVRTGTRRRIVAIAAKHALHELDLPEGVVVPNRVVADPMASTLKAFAERDRSLVRDVVDTQMSRFAALEGTAQARALARLGDDDFFWDAVDAPVRDRLVALVEQPGLPVEERMAVIALVGVPVAREHLPALEEIFNAMPLFEQIDVMAARPTSYFVPTLIEVVKRTPNWATGSYLANRVLVEHAEHLTSAQLEDLLQAWVGNDQCRLANGMPEAAARMAALTAGVYPENRQHWTEFLKLVRIFEQSGYYSYRELELELEQAVPVSSATDPGVS
ncbi:hypothetical protein OHA18_41440 [Kribbella sp. NBC_00709]|uniref:hypothetical protein n=1 Tax=Kribbella sp. NBC_00709 TaxID=2975972 RepID=UPI002E28BA85|nr:hypothetical protein [Kribbella sp. NBC_00709]